MFAVFLEWIFCFFCFLKAELGKTETLGIGGSGGGFEDDDALFDIADMEDDHLFSLPWEGKPCNKCGFRGFNNKSVEFVKFQERI